MHRLWVALSLVSATAFPAALSPFYTCELLDQHPAEFYTFYSEEPLGATGQEGIVSRLKTVTGFNLNERTLFTDAKVEVKLWAGINQMTFTDENGRAMRFFDNALGKSVAYRDGIEIGKIACK